MEQAKGNNEEEHLEYSFMSPESDIVPNLEEGREEVVIREGEEHGSQHGAQSAVEDCRANPRALHVIPGATH